MNRDADYVQVLGWDNNPQRGSEALARHLQSALSSLRRSNGREPPSDG